MSETVIEKLVDQIATPGPDGGVHKGARQAKQLDFRMMSAIIEEALAAEAQRGGGGGK